MALPKLHIKQLALFFAQSQVGEKETPGSENRGPMVDDYLRAVGLNPGFAWCMAFVYWCYAMASKAMAITNPLLKNAGVLNVWNGTKNENLIYAPDAKATPLLIAEGDIIIFKHGITTGHAGIVESVVKNAKGEWEIHTIEGNTNSGGSREGIAVERKVRLLTDPQLLGFIHFK